VTDSNRDPKEIDPKDDPRSVDELVFVALTEPDEDLSWDAICALHWRGSHDVLDHAAGLCRSSCSVERRVGANMLGQLGVPDRTFPEECLRLLLEMLEDEPDHQVLPAILIGLSHLHRSETVVPALRFRQHADADVRLAVVDALMGQEDPSALNGLIGLMRDDDADVRDWATFSLGTQVEVDTPGIRDALAERLHDPDDVTRDEALVGLARRRDWRVIPALRAALASDSVSDLQIEAAALVGDPELYPQLVALQEWWSIDDEGLRDAIQACSPIPENTG